MVMGAAVAAKTARSAQVIGCGRDHGLNPMNTWNPMGRLDILLCFCAQPWQSQSWDVVHGRGHGSWDLQGGGGALCVCVGYGGCGPGGLCVVVAVAAVNRWGLRVCCCGRVAMQPLHSFVHTAPHSTPLDPALPNSPPSTPQVFLKRHCGDMGYDKRVPEYSPSQALGREAHN